MKSQASMEFMITVGFAFLLIIPLTIILYQHLTDTREDIYNSQAGLVARKITEAANSVYYLGSPSTVTLKIYMPEQVDKINMTDREFVITLKDGKEIVAISVANLTGTVSPGSGTKFIQISALENKVNITEQ